MATTFCTNHVRQVGIHFVKWIRKGDRAYLSRCLNHVKMLVMFVAGSTIGMVLCRFFLGKAIWGASLLLLIVFIDLLHADLTKEKGMLERVPRGH